MLLLLTILMSASVAPSAQPSSILAEWTYDDRGRVTSTFATNAERGNIGGGGIPVERTFSYTQASVAFLSENVRE